MERGNKKKTYSIFILNRRILTTLFFLRSFVICLISFKAAVAVAVAATAAAESAANNKCVSNV